MNKFIPPRRSESLSKRGISFSGSKKEGKRRLSTFPATVFCPLGPLRPVFEPRPAPVCPFSLFDGPKMTRVMYRPKGIALASNTGREVTPRGKG